MSDQPQPQKQLSAHDRAVLNAIFNPSEIGGDISQQQLQQQLAADCDADQLPAELQDNCGDDDASDNPALLESQRLEAAAVWHSEAAEWPAALEAFAAALAQTPLRASLYNNRAQTHRLMGNDEAAMGDLTVALRLCAGAGRTGCRALCQRGLLHRRAERVDEARADFASAARLGSPFARAQLIELNPYAALCNQMLQQAFKQLS